MKEIKRGVTAYSYNKVFGIAMDLDDIFQHIQDTGASGIEILANAHIPHYPQVKEEWLDSWHEKLQHYQLEPAEYGHWVDSRLYKNRELTTKESIEMLERDFKLANQLGFKILRTKLGVIDDTLTPVKNWQEFIKGALALAEKYDVRMCPEIHSPTVLNSKMIDDYVTFIEKENTKYFGLNIDFSVFQTGDNALVGFGENDFVGPPAEHSQVSELIPLLKYVYVCHTKFLKMDQQFREVVIPYPEIIQVLQENEWSGYLISEYEGPRADEVAVVCDQVKRHQLMLKELLGK
ncbi:sugar phosphate isomerase/epimerase [Enterococcus gallinarum]|jgi:sugar phosphate isomerase/epimerase|uniref:sugar phosphate isomerase/epimerase family protein n=2 Tax=Enterococcus gallinarum TaxID=1353 RepID=UPI001E2AD72C|nr:TIM barrel protein [Enterococcus gallinarum]MCD5184835.1 sugar phosphate isomerase/epimerase [Enterococcus gallinarum]MEB6064742.1 sugar phosphate isomerase/epimerase [Enterococcus gallinarum]